MSDTIHISISDERGDQPDSIDAADFEELLWYLPILGPTATIMLHLLVGMNGPVDLGVLARRLGVDSCKARQTLTRLERFHCGMSFTVNLNGVTAAFVVNRWLPPLTRRQIERHWPELITVDPAPASEN